MSTASAASPTLIRSSSRRQQSYIPTPDRPHRSSSTTSKPPTTPSGVSRTISQSQARQASSSQQPPLAEAARRDYEASNVVRTPSSRRSSSRDRSHPIITMKRSESTRDSRHTPTRPGHSRHSSHMSATVAAAAIANGASAAGSSPAGKPQVDAAAHANGSSNKRRTTVTAQTGQWTLGKTIGAGSMGKVKLAKNLETGEQVGRKIEYHSGIYNFDLLSSRLRSRLYQGNLPMNIILAEIESGQTIRRKSGQPEKQLSSLY